MRRRCAWCKRSLGPDVKPLDDLTWTDGGCPECAKKLEEEVGLEPETEEERREAERRKEKG